MAKNLSPQVKGIILFAYLLLITLLTAMGGGGDVDKLNLDDSTVVLALKISQAVSVLVLFIIPVILFILFSSEKKLSYLKLNSFSFTIGIATILLVFAVLPVINWTGEINSHLSLPSFMSGIENWMKESEASLKKLTDVFLKMNSIGDLLLNIVVIALFAAVGEELLFRGAIQNVLVEWTGKKHLSVWVTAILFSALHAQFYGFLPRMLLGVVLGYLYIWSGSLWLSMLFHFLNNAMAVLFSYLIGLGKMQEGSDNIGAGENIPYVVVAASALISIGLMYFIYKNKKQEVISGH